MEEQVYQELCQKMAKRGGRFPGMDILEYYNLIKELFTPFYTTKATGMGMGLSISRSIVEAHGGRIWYKTKQGFGACFYFTLPVSNDD